MLLLLHHAFVLHSWPNAAVPTNQCFLSARLSFDLLFLVQEAWLVFNLTSNHGAKPLSHEKSSTVDLQGKSVRLKRLPEFLSHVGSWV
jgi:hypothetical protein